jgi:hypothetical protein
MNGLLRLIALGLALSGLVETRVEAAGLWIGPSDH